MYKAVEKLCFSKNFQLKHFILCVLYPCAIPKQFFELTTLKLVVFQKHSFSYPISVNRKIKVDQLQLEDSGGESYQYHSDNQSTTTQNQQQHVLTATSSRQRHSSNMNQNGSSSGGKHATGGSGVGVNNGVNNKTLENEKRIRREIANSNERRRMQSINAGFQNLRSLLPRHEGEKLSKRNNKKKRCSHLIISHLQPP
uniref:BHLH domain-containing protein n=1 Tax=Glossina brevipalpis TaxID=37001 RepID=A0A1A9WNZ5_9MUSC